MGSSTLKKAIQAIEDAGILLVYPLQNKKEPASLWTALYPRSTMRWEWDDEGDSRVADLWHQRMELSVSNRVVYAKWFQGRATFFSRETFVNLLAMFGTTARDPHLPFDSTRVLDVLRSDSPLSTRELKRLADLSGKFLESRYNRAMKPLWQKLQLVGYGEIEDSSFPSLAIGATELMFEDLWSKAKTRDAKTARAQLLKQLGEANKFLQFAEKILAQSSGRFANRSVVERRF